MILFSHLSIILMARREIAVFGKESDRVKEERSTRRGDKRGIGKHGEGTKVVFGPCLANRVSCFLWNRRDMEGVGEGWIIKAGRPTISRGLHSPPPVCSASLILLPKVFVMSSLI